MLSSLPGAAVSQVKIDGVLHEFSSIPGVKEDVTEIIMNLKVLPSRITVLTMSRRPHTLSVKEKVLLQLLIFRQIRISRS